MSSDQDQALLILETALWRIGYRGDCDYYDEKSRPNPCDCAHCISRAALAAAKSWRFHGAFHQRTLGGHWPREVKMHAAWVKLATAQDPDHLLTSILQDKRMPSARDWYVATSVIQWLATDVGMTVLEAAGFKYQQDDQDRADGELFRRRQEREENERRRDNKIHAPEEQP